MIHIIITLLTCSYYRIRRKLVNRWVEKYKDPIDLMDCSSTMEIDLCWYKKKPTIRSYNLTGHLMVHLGTIIAIASMTYIVDLDASEAHSGDEKVIKDLIDE